MKKITFLTFVLLTISFLGISQTSHVTGNIVLPELKVSSRIGIIISTNDPETVWNAFRFADFSCQEGDSVSVFLLGKGVEAEKIENKDFDVKEMMNSYVESGGKIFTCGTCLRSRNMGGTELCPISTMSDMYEIVKKSDKLLTF
jgi:sulfur relay (sulfurtransferase) complex TusBCD TusD component (DsrE family)